MQIVIRTIEDLHPHPQNYRQHPVNQIELIANSLRSHGQQKPIVISEDNTILAGHGVWEAAAQANLSSLSCVVYTGPNPEAFLIIDNRSSELAVDDTYRLAELLRDMDTGADLPETGYTAEEIEDLLRLLADNTITPDFTPATEAEQGKLDKKETTVTCPGCGHVFIP